MKNLIIAVKVIPGNSIEQDVEDAMILAKELDCMIELKRERREAHIMPLSKPEDIYAQLEGKNS